MPSLLTYDARLAQYKADPTAAIPCCTLGCEADATHWVISRPSSATWDLLGAAPAVRPGPPTFCLPHATAVQAARNSKVTPRHDVPEAYQPPGPAKKSVRAKKA